ncbi:lipopolysaccharide assembly protein LapB [Streptomyces sp. V3I7]|uniref:tetratricopeptide repeat protein n=1 Tax=Streptomyces sp. V3I7 TaxID=3042278 RepID=UPI0027832614|nr:tetratricopeptide repeat protein [Streptomyces sp. V3I7]MDQ0991171.1 tetratricopeptide (TPR) repeat protein [Streptomyces sp. V3I7]
MENEQSGPGTSLVAPAPPSRPRALRRVLLASLAAGVAGAAVFGGLLSLVPSAPPAPPRAGLPAPGPKPQTLTTVTAGMPAALPGLTGLIADRERHLRAHPQDAQAWTVLGTAYAERGRRSADAADYPKAEQALKTALEVRGEEDARSAPALEGLAALANARRDFDEARSRGEQALELSPKRWTAYPLLIDAYTGLGDYESARGTLDDLMKLRVGAEAKPAVMARAAAVYRDRGWREDAQAQVADAAAGARTPAEQAAYLEQAGQLAWERGDRHDALRHYEAALRLDPDQRAAMAGRGRALAALGRTAEAVKAYRAALAGHPAPQYALELGELYESQGMREQAQAQYDLLLATVERNTSDGVDGELVAGQYEADHGDPQDAVDRLRAEWERQPGIEVADALGWALYRAGDPEGALHYAAIATDKTKGGGVRSALYSYHRGVIERELDDGPVARRFLQDALRVNPYFSPLRAPEARQALAELGDPPDEPVPDDLTGIQ